MIPHGLFSLALAAASAALGGAGHRNTTDYSIPHEKYVLPSNGLEVILAPDHSLPIVAVNIWYHAGPINEAQGRTGFAHLFEHLMFQGSQHVGDDQHIKWLEAAGASMINGTTSYDRTNYFETLPASQLPLALWLESDRMGFLQEALTQDKLDNQRQVVQNERRQSVENVPYGPSDEKLVQTLLPPGHPYYGNVIGSMEDLNAATLDDVRDFYRRYYAPANATLVVAGDYDEQEVKPLVDKYFGTLGRRSAPTAAEITTPVLTAERRVTVSEPVSLARVSWAWVSPAAYTQEDAECDILAFVLGHGVSSRLYQKLVHELGLAQDVSVYQESLALGSMFVLTATARPGVDLQTLEEQAQKVVDELKQNPPLPREVERARNQLMTEQLVGLQRIGGFGGRADLLNRYNQYVGKTDYLAADLQRYQRVTPADVSQRASALLRREARAVVLTVPSGQGERG